MQIGIHIEPEGAGYDEILALARVTEDAGFAVFSRSDHYLPHERPGAPLGPTDAWITLAGLARETSRIRLATLMSNPNLRHPSVLAVALAQLDSMSGGRIELGLGAGWFEQENAQFGFEMPADWTDRYDRRAEYMTVLRGVWSATEAEPFSFKGHYYQLDAAPGLGAVVQDRSFPRLVLAVTDAPRTFSDAVTWGDEVNLVFLDVEQTRAALASVDAQCDAQGRARESLARSVVQVICCGRDDAEVERRAEAIGRLSGHLEGTILSGTPGAVVSKLRQFEQLGIERAYLQIRDAADIDHVQLLGEHVAGAFPA